MPLENKDTNSEDTATSASEDISPGATSSSSSDVGHHLDLSGDGEMSRKKQRINSPLKTSPITSPHKHATFEELMKTSGLVTNMALAHEIVVDGNFKLKQEDLPENSLIKQVRDIMHRAFWDNLEEQLGSEPPLYHHAITLLGEVKELLLSILLPHHDRLRTQINEVIDLPLIQQQAEHGILDVHHYGHFIIGTMATLCAPVRDEEIANLKEITDIVQLFREIFRMLDLMKLDMANFTLQSLRPHLKQQSVDYERSKFQEFLKTQQDGLELTRKWLEEAADDLRSELSTEGGVSPVSSSLTPVNILTHAYMQLLKWDNARIFPETVIMDKSRLLDMRDQLDKLVLIATVLLVTYTNVGPIITDEQGFPSKLKHHLLAILEGVSNTHSVVPNIADQVLSDVNQCLRDRGRPEIDGLSLEALKSQVLAAGRKEHTVHTLLDSRARSFMKMLISVAINFDPASRIPPGLSSIQPQLLEVAGQFVRVIGHNRTVFGPFYSDLLGEILNIR